MILYITTTIYNKFITEALYDCKCENSQSIIDSSIHFGNYIKKNIDRLSSFDTVIIDLTVLQENDDEFIDSLNSFRILFDNVKIIILAPNRCQGDKLLSNIFALGIYNIVSFKDDLEKDYDRVKSDLMECITKGMNYKDGSKYREVKSLVGDDLKEASRAIKEKIIIQKEIHQTVSKAIIGFMGTQNRIGTTHNAIVSANFLHSLGYSVALVESSLCKTKCLNSVKDFYDDIIQTAPESDHFTYNGIDFYPNYAIEESYKLQAKNYNFIIEDFGCCEKPENFIEFDRCVIQIIVSGFKEWELSHINTLFECAGEERIKNFSYLFNYTSTSKLPVIKKGMSGLSKVYISGYCPDPFSDSYESLNDIFKGYIPEKHKINSKSGIRLNIVNDIIDKIPKLPFKRVGGK